jgi:hypothetical protein
MADALAERPPADASRDLERRLLVTELLGDLSERVERLRAQVAISRHAPGQTVVRGPERALERQPLQTAVAPRGVVGVEAHLAAEQVSVREFERCRGPVDVAGAVELDVLAEAQEVRIVEANPRAVHATAAAEAGARLEGPHIARADLDVDEPVVVRDRADRGVPQVAVPPEDPGGLLEPERVEAVARLEGQLLADDALARRDVETVRRPEDRLVLAGTLYIEHVGGADDDLADHDSRRNQGGVVGHGSGRVGGVGDGHETRGQSRREERRQQLRRGSS